MRWFEEYACGCVSETVDRKRDLLGYCAIHGADQRHIYRESPRLKAQPLPKGVEVFRASGDCVCSECSKLYHDHPRYAYPWGDGFAVRVCDGRFLHL